MSAKRSLFSLLALLLCLLTLAACDGPTAPEHKLTYVDSKRMDIPFNDSTLDCVCVFTQYTNASAEAALPADHVRVQAYQNGAALSPWVFTGTETEGYLPCDSSIRSGATADIVWIFERRDSSPVTVEYDGGEVVVVE